MRQSDRQAEHLALAQTDSPNWPTTQRLEAAENALAALVELLAGVTATLITAEIRAVVGACKAMSEFENGNPLDILHEDFLRQFVDHLVAYF